MTVSALATSIIDRLGVAGIGVGVFLNGLGVPGFSEVLLPLAGVGVKQGRLDLVTVFVVAMVFQLAGVSIAYAIARYGGVVMVERYGKYILVSHKELKTAQRAFDKHGEWLILFGAFIPGIQGFIGYIGGLAEMNYWRFIASAFVGKLVWVGGLLYLGSVLGNHMDLIDRSIKQIGVIVLLALILFITWYIIRHNRQGRRTRAHGEEID